MKEVIQRTTLVPGANGEVVKMTITLEKNGCIRIPANCRDYVDWFFVALRKSIESEKAYINGFYTGLSIPDFPQYCGWKGWLSFDKFLHKPNGKLIGWVYDNYLFLDMDSACSLAEEAANEMQIHLPSKRKLIKMIKQRGLIASSEMGRNLTRIPVSKKHVLHVRVNDLFPEIILRNYRGELGRKVVKST